MINFDNVKDIVIAEWHGNHPKSGDKYRRLVSQIDNIINAINDPHSIMNYLSHYICSDNEMAKIIIQYLKRPITERLFLSNVKKGNYSSKYQVMLTYDYEDEDQNEDARKLVPDLERPLINISNRKKEVLKILSSDSFTSINSGNIDMKLLAIKAVLEQVLSDLREEKSYFYQKNILSFCINYTILYIDLCQSIVLYTLLFYITNNNHKEEREEILSYFEMFFNDIHSQVIMKINTKSKEREKRYRDLKPKYVNRFDDTFIISQNIEAALRTDSYFKILNNIDDKLVEELEYNNFKPLDECVLKKIKNNEYVDSVDNLIKGHFRINKINDKIYNIKSLLKFFDNIDNANGDDNTENNGAYILHNIIAFQETYISKLTYNRRTASTIVKYILNEEFSKLKEYDLCLLSEKYIRGSFTIQGMNNEYRDFIRITKKCRQLFLQLYKISLDIEQLEIASEIAHASLDSLYNILYRIIPLNNINKTLKRMI